MLKLFTDSDTDITPEIASKYGYFILPMPFELDGVNYYPWHSYTTFDFHEYNEKLRNGAMPTTSALNVGEYLQFFEPTFQNGDDIFYVHFSEKMSGTFKNMDEAVKILKEKYPERKFYALDTKAISIGALSIVVEISKLFASGATVEEIYKWAETEIYHYATYYYADGLSFFKRSGRVNGLTAAMGKILGLKPIIIMDKEGSMHSHCVEKGKKKALNHIMSIMEEIGDDVENHDVYLGHCDAPEIMEEFRAMVLEKYPKANITIINGSPTVVAHCGPSTIGISFHSKCR